MNREEYILRFIKSVRESFGASIAVYTCGNCYQFYEILKVVFPDAIAYESGGHVVTKIGDDYYDIRGKCDRNLNTKLVVDSRIEGLSVNKWTDEMRMSLKEEGFSKINDVIYDREKVNIEGDRIIIKQDIIERS
jgi:hypothetical protein